MTIYLWFLIAGTVVTASLLWIRALLIKTLRPSVLEPISVEHCVRNWVNTREIGITEKFFERTQP